MTDNNYEEKFLQARSAYLEGDLQQASVILDEMIDEDSEDPSVLLLRGHIHLSDQEYDVARGNYQKVLGLTDNEDLIQLAHEGLQKIETVPEDEEEEEDIFALEQIEEPDFSDEIEEIDDEGQGDAWTESIQFDNIEWDMDDLEEEEVEDPTLQQNDNFKKTSSQEGLNSISSASSLIEEFDDQEEDTAVSLLPTTATHDVSQSDFESEEDEDLLGDFDPSSFNYDQLEDFDDQDDFDEEDMEDNSAPTFVVASEEPELGDLEQMLTGNSHLFSDMDDDYGDYSSELQPLNSIPDTDEDFTVGNIPTIKTGDNDDDDSEILGDDDFFFAPDDLDDIPDIEADELPVSSIFTKDNKPESEIPTNSSINSLDTQENVFDSEFDNDITGSFTFDTQKINLDIDEDISVSSPLSEASEVSTGIQLVPEVEISRGKLSQYFDLSLFRKQLFHSGITTLITFVAILLFSSFGGGKPSSENSTDGSTTGENAPEQVETEAADPAPTNEPSAGSKFVLALLTSVTAGGATLALGLLFNKHVKSYTNDLQNQFESIYQGNYEVKVTVASQDELGTLAAGFNQMAKMINTTTTEARKRAEETERAREDLQRQVIRLLDDVEGAARGDLTVQAEVTADVLGAVADAFNLTITSLRKIVKQVQQAAIQVNKASADSEVFARNQSSDALRMAEELAVTLNSVQMMTDSIQRVAENAQEAEEVARSSSVTALKGGDAVERTVAGILQIRETVSETTRKVKRLAEASQQISTIVAVISQISSRTNLLALNASIQAARAGDAGRGFAIVADEVRQLADRSAKSLQEIEQIVLQIQTETGSVMTAMEEGIQQVRDVTERSEQAKRALEDIIQVSNRIDALVRSITADTDEQRENSRGVAKVMQAVELTAQATSQESQRVAGSLQNLVGIGKDLISSVERFKVD